VTAKASKSYIKYREGPEIIEFDNSILPGVVGTPDVEGLILKAEDGYGGEVNNEIVIRIYD